MSVPIPQPPGIKAGHIALYAATDGQIQIPKLSDPDAAFVA
jgi:hypothetical protein